MGKTKNNISRRKFIDTSVKATVLSAITFGGFPEIVPSTVFGKNAPSKKINIGQIGCGPIALTHDLAETLNHDAARIVAVADPDSKRRSEGKQYIENYYSKKRDRSGYTDVRAYEDYQSILEDPGIDAVIISTAGYRHTRPAIEAALARKDIYLQTPTALSIKEGRLLCDVVKRQKVILQTGTHQRSMEQFRYAAELVRNGRIGVPCTVKIGLQDDPSGIITNDPGIFAGRAQHHFDSAAWGMDTEMTGPVFVEAVAQFPVSPTGEVNGDFIARAEFDKGLTMLTGSCYPDGILYEGTEGWIFVTRSSPVLIASDPLILTGGIRADETHLCASNGHHGNWLECIVSRREPISPVEPGHRACTIALITHISMTLGRRLSWDPGKEEFINDNEANDML